jgi:hypothetical protein
LYFVVIRDVIICVVGDGDHKSTWNCLQIFICRAIHVKLLSYFWKSMKWCVYM